MRILIAGRREWAEAMAADVARTTPHSGHQFTLAHPGRPAAGLHDLVLIQHDGPEQVATQAHAAAAENAAVVLID
ncbi:hypothetical protein [Galactobacter valiniphilus]|uniref:hypothetical protein n=1 Tax=Galactobacter valiniphilus TaxID=2676122 RepID=UPI00373609F2